MSVKEHNHTDCVRFLWTLKENIACIMSIAKFVKHVTTLSFLTSWSPPVLPFPTGCTVVPTCRENFCTRGESRGEAIEANEKNNILIFYTPEIFLLSLCLEDFFIFLLDWHFFSPNSPNLRSTVCFSPSHTSYLCFQVSQHPLWVPLTGKCPSPDPILCPGAFPGAPLTPSAIPISSASANTPVLRR